MRKILIPLMIVSMFVAFYEQSKEQPNLLITVLCVIIFIIGMIQLSSKIPSKNQDDDDAEV
jgi:hypothetical protein